MTDGQFTALLTAIVAGGAGLGGMIRWIVGFWSKAADKRAADYVASQREADETARASTHALIGNTASNAVLIVKIDALGTTVTALGNKLDGIGDWMQEHTPIGAPPRAPRTRTPAHGAPTEYYERPSSGMKRGGG